MNINLAVSSTIQRSIQDDIDEAKAVMAGVVEITGRVALVPDDSSGLPGVYRVWFENHQHAWIWVDEEGVMHYKECPLST